MDANVLNAISSTVNSGVSVHEETQLLFNVFRGFDYLLHHEILVGIPQENNSSHNGGLTNAELLFIHSNGSPVMNIPARPTIEPAIAEHDTAEAIKNQLIDMMSKALMGNIKGAETAANKAGMIGMAAAQKKFGSGDLAPNAPITIHGGWMYNRVSGKPFFVKGKGSSAPLIDTGALRQAITYVVRRK